eukprot:m51a1_g10347 hypothetical protein (700) ;mRNA; r:167095-169381
MRASAVVVAVAALAAVASAQWRIQRLQPAVIPGFATDTNPAATPHGSDVLRVEYALNTDGLTSVMLYCSADGWTTKILTPLAVAQTGVPVDGVAVAVWAANVTVASWLECTAFYTLQGEPVDTKHWATEGNYKLTSASLVLFASPPRPADITAVAEVRVQPGAPRVFTLAARVHRGAGAGPVGGCAVHYTTWNATESRDTWPTASDANMTLATPGEDWDLYSVVMPLAADRVWGGNVHCRVGDKDVWEMRGKNLFVRINDAPDFAMTLLPRPAAAAYQLPLNDPVARVTAQTQTPANATGLPGPQAGIACMLWATLNGIDWSAMPLTFLRHEGGTDYWGLNVTLGPRGKLTDTLKCTQHGQEWWWNMLHGTQDLNQKWVVRSDNETNVPGSEGDDCPQDATTFSVTMDPSPSAGDIHVPASNCVANLTLKTVTPGYTGKGPADNVRCWFYHEPFTVQENKNPDSLEPFKFAGDEGCADVWTVSYRFDPELKSLMGTAFCDVNGKRLWANEKYSGRNHKWVVGDAPIRDPTIVMMPTPSATPLTVPSNDPVARIVVSTTTPGKEDVPGLQAGTRCTLRMGINGQWMDQPMSFVAHEDGVDRWAFNVTLKFGDTLEDTVMCTINGHDLWFHDANPSAVQNQKWVVVAAPVASSSKAASSKKPPEHSSSPARHSSATHASTTSAAAALAASLLALPLAALLL